MAERPIRHLRPVDEPDHSLAQQAVEGLIHGTSLVEDEPWRVYRTPSADEHGHSRQVNLRVHPKLANAFDGLVADTGWFPGGRSEAMRQAMWEFLKKWREFSDSAADIVDPALAMAEVMRMKAEDESLREFYSLVRGANPDGPKETQKMYEQVRKMWLWAKSHGRERAASDLEIEMNNLSRDLARYADTDS